MRSKTIFILFDRRVKTRKQERSNEEEESCMVNDYFSCNLYVWKVVLLTHPDRTWTYICPTLWCQSQVHTYAVLLYVLWILCFSNFVEDKLRKWRKQSICVVKMFNFMLWKCKNKKIIKKKKRRGITYGKWLLCVQCICFEGCVVNPPRYKMYIYRTLLCFTKVICSDLLENKQNKTWVTVVPA